MRILIFVALLGVAFAAPAAFPDDAPIEIQPDALKPEDIKQEEPLPDPKLEEQKIEQIKPEEIKKPEHNGDVEITEDIFKPYDMNLFMLYSGFADPEEYTPLDMTASVMLIAAPPAAMDRRPIIHKFGDAVFSEGFD